MTTPASAPKSDRERALELVDVSRETLALLDRFVDLLAAAQRTTNLISNASMAQVWTRHVADSFQLLALALEAKVWVDLGSGAGFPGLVLACGLVNNPGAKVHLVESTQKKANFLRQAAAALGVPVIVHAVRIEDFVNSSGVTADIVVARALAPLNKLLGLARPLLERGAKGLFMKGQDVAAELTKAARYWRFEPRLIPSKTHQDGRIVAIDGLERRSNVGPTPSGSVGSTSGRNPGRASSGRSRSARSR